MKIVLIGAGGFLGSTLFKGLHKYNNNIEWHLFSSLPVILQDAKIRCHLYQWPMHSLADDSYKNVLLDSDVIIYAAGAGIQPGENVKEELIFNLNLAEPVRLVQTLIKLDFKGQLISFGSYFETGLNQPEYLLDEQTFLEQFNPLPNAYCRSKKEFTHYHFTQTLAGLEFKWLHLILTNIYGPGENKNRLIPYIIDRSKKNEVLHFTTGQQIRQYTYVEDVAKVVFGLMGKASGLYHVTNEEALSVKTIIEETVEQVREKLSVDPVIQYDIPERRDTSMVYLAVSPGKLLNEWNLSCPTGYKEGISRYFKP